MPTAFSKDRWRAKAWSRFQKASRPGTASSVPPNDLWYGDMLHIEFIERVIQWCTSRRLKVVFEKRSSGMYNPEEATIYITTHVRPQKQLHYLLHEVGHFLVGVKLDEDRFGKGYPMGDKPTGVSAVAHKIACLEEEFEAWHRGWKLAKRLRLDVDRAAFDRTRIDCLKSYVGWTHRRGK